ncbi:MAG: LAGLIDADG family homing endonuclease [Bellilinea sp.]
MDSHLKSWAAGFIDGEGCFLLEIKRYPKRNGYFVVRPKFVVQVRADNKAAIYMLQEAIGRPGYMFNRTSRKRSTYGSESKPTVECFWQTSKDLLAVVALLDEFPLLGKKLDDYRIWRQAVILMTRGNLSVNERNLNLLVLKEQLQEVRRYSV